MKVEVLKMEKEQISKRVAEHKTWLSTGGVAGVRANLYGADLTRANLYGVDLTRADLTMANLSRADLTRANLYGANLYRTNLYRANLSGANLSRTNLSGANLSGANLSGADLTRANLSGADLYGANLPEKTYALYGYPYFIQLHGNEVRAGCQVHTAERWRSFTRDHVYRMDKNDCEKALNFYPRLLDLIDFYCGPGSRPDWVK